MNNVEDVTQVRYTMKIVTVPSITRQIIEFEDNGSFTFCAAHVCIKLIKVAVSLEENRKNVTFNK